MPKTKHSIVQRRKGETCVPENGRESGELSFRADLTWDGDTGADVRLGESSSLSIDMLPEFGGKGEGFCPDELFFASIGGCLLQTFLFIQRKLRLDLTSLRVVVIGRVGHADARGYELTSVKATIHVKTSSESKVKAEECVRLTRSFCHITRLIEKSVNFELTSKISTSSSE
jgi:uncharacterized OsmC-like protein